MSRSAAAINAGQKWVKEDDDKLLEKLLTNPDVPFDQLADEFQRTAGSIQNRAMNLLMQMSSDDNPLEDLCAKYNVDWKDMEKYRLKKDNRIQARRETRRKARRGGGGGSVGSGSESGATNNETLLLLREIREQITVIQEKLSQQ